MNFQNRLSELQKKYNEVEISNRSLSSKLSELFILYNLTRILTTTFDLKKVFKNIFSLFQESLTVEYNSIILEDSFARDLDLNKIYGSAKQGKKNIIYPVESIHEKIVKKKSFILRPIVNQEEIVPDKETSVHFPLQLLGFPLIISSKKIIGSLSFFREEGNSFQPDEIEFLQRVADEVSNILDKIYLFYQTKEDTFRDHLTGVYNRRYFNQRLDMEIKRAERYKRSFSMLMIDIDDFKLVNDTYGHITGDEILKELTKILKKNLRNSDILSRFGGEEFVALLPETNSQNAFLTGEKLRTEVENKLIIPEDHKKNVTISIGVANYPVDAYSAEKLVDKADRRLYQAKNKGKNSTVMED
ncbi:MAG TPA: sensor domain-containing diguanylate cyclase [Bacteroidetes bacterium]|nr:sensor domain-containing diguanylate cyclase [Bacteroidota bacterium]